MFESRVIVAVALALGCGLASAEVYKCVDQEGKVLYSESKLAAGCQRVQSDRVSVVPAGPVARRSSEVPLSEGRVSQANGGRRRADLEGQLRTAQAALDEAQRQLDEQSAQRYGNESNYQSVLDRLQPFKDNVALRERDVDAIKQELGNLP